ncbi:hypothetical protein [Desulforamulus profundi]
MQSAAGPAFSGRVQQVDQRQPEGQVDRPLDLGVQYPKDGRVQLKK